MLYQKWFWGFSVVNTDLLCLAMSVREEFEGNDAPEKRESVWTSRRHLPRFAAADDAGHELVVTPKDPEQLFVQRIPIQSFLARELIGTRRHGNPGCLWRLRLTGHHIWEEHVRYPIGQLTNIDVVAIAENRYS